MANNTLIELSLNFAVRILNICDRIKGHYSLKNQLERSGTSIGANIREANYAQSRADFISKMQIALKECYETEYWLELLYETDYLDSQEFQSIHADCQELLKILTAITKSQKGRDEA